MTDFTPSGDITQSDDNKTLKYTENSNYGDNTQSVDSGEVISRMIKLYDANNILLDQGPLVLEDGDYVFYHAITSDVYIAWELTVTVTGPVEYIGTTKNTSIGFYNAAFIAAMRYQTECGCSTPNPCHDITFSQNLKKAALLLGIRGFGLKSQQDIDDAIVMVTSLSNC